MSATESSAVVTPFRASKLDLGLTPDLADTFRIAAKAGRAYMSTAMLLGESGVGKTIIARHIHQSSDRASRPFQVIDLSQATPSLFESEFFGHERGSFTGAAQSRKSPFEMANGGTVFLDEIGTLSFELQARLLRIIQDKTFKRVGGSEDIKVDVRILAATSLNLEEKVIKGEFREDLYHRLNVLQIHVPPLRERRNDIIPLAEYFLQQASIVDRLPLKQLSEESKAALVDHDWPGNVRALENEMLRATIMTDGDVIDPSDLSFYQRVNNLFSLPVANAPEVSPHPVPVVAPASYDDLVETLAGLGLISEIGDACEEAGRYLIDMAVLASADESGEYSLGRTAKHLNCTSSSLGSAAQSHFRLQNVKFPSLVDALPAWRETRENHDHAALSQRIAQRLFDDPSQFSSQDNLIKRIESDVLHPARVALVKSALLQHNFSQADAARSIGKSDGYITWLLQKDQDFGRWVAEGHAVATAPALDSLHSNLTETAACSLNARQPARRTGHSRRHLRFSR